MRTNFGSSELGSVTKFRSNFRTLVSLPSSTSLHGCLWLSGGKRWSDKRRITVNSGNTSLGSALDAGLSACHDCGDTVGRRSASVLEKKISSVRFVGMVYERSVSRESNVNRLRASSL